MFVYERGALPEDIKVGDVFFSVCTYTDEDGKVSCDIDEYHVRSIRRKRRSKSDFYFSMPERGVRVNFVRKVKGVTWVKKSKKHFDWGWASYIPTHYKESALLDEKLLPIGMYSNKIEALEYEMSLSEYRRAKYFDDPEITNEIDKEISTMKSRLTRLKNSKN